MTSNPLLEISAHQRAEGSEFTRKYGLHKLVYMEEIRNPYAAIDRENQLNGWARSRCELLVAAVNPRWDEIDLLHITGHEMSPRYLIPHQGPLD